MKRSLVALLAVALGACAAPGGDAQPPARQAPRGQGGHGGEGTGGAPGEGGSLAEGGAPPGTGGEGGTPMPPPDECDAYPYQAATLLAERVGFGADTTGGDPATVYHVTTLAPDGPGSLRAGVESADPNWIVFDVEGTIELDEDGIEIASNKTIDGRGRDITIDGRIKIEHAENIIVSDVKITNPSPDDCEGDDIVGVRGDGAGDPEGYTVKNLWFHHVEAFAGGDGLIDFRGASKITISWSHFHSHKKAMLAWTTTSGLPATGMRVTYHHNFFDRITLRGPQFVYGWAHFFNNYQFEWYEYGSASLDGAQFYSESNVYQARPGSFCLLDCPDPNPCGDNDYLVSKEALVVEWDNHEPGYTKSVGDVTRQGAQLAVNQPAQVFDPSALYGYTAEPAGDALVTAIQQGAGARASYCQ